MKKIDGLKDDAKKDYRLKDADAHIAHAKTVVARELAAEAVAEGRRTIDRVEKDTKVICDDCRDSRNKLQNRLNELKFDQATAKADRLRDLAKKFPKSEFPQELEAAEAQAQEVYGSVMENREKQKKEKEAAEAAEKAAEEAKKAKIAEQERLKEEAKQ